MKKIIFMIVAFLATYSLSAQTFSTNKWYDNTYVGINTGVSAWLHPTVRGYDNFSSSFRSISSLRVGKYVTPFVGFEVEGEVGFANHVRFVDHTSVGGNLLFNLNNIMHKYKGMPDRVEFVPFLGVNWNHMYDYSYDNIGVKYGAQVNFNMGKQKKWQINVIPSVNYLLTDEGFNDDINGQPRFDSKRSYVALQVGVSYKFKNSKNTHNFELCPYQYTSDDYQKLKDVINNRDKQIEALTTDNLNKDKVIKEKDSEIARLNAREMVTNNIITINSVVGFDIGKSKVSNTQKASLKVLADSVKDKDAKLFVIGYADAKTGSKKRNEVLSQERADNVKKILVEMGVKEENISVIYKGDTEQPFDENDMNRAVIFTSK